MASETDPRNFRFGDVIENGWASVLNPQRYGYFVGRGARTGRLNNGPWIRLTDGNSNFWEHMTNGEHKLRRIARASLPPRPLPQEPS